MKVGLVWEDKLSFVLNDQRVISKFTMLDTLKGEVDEDEDLLVTEFALMSMETRRLMLGLSALCS